MLDELVPAAGQGALALEARTGAFAAERLEPRPRRGRDRVRDAPSVSSSRALEAACDTPIGAHARPLGDGRLELEAWVGLPDGSEWIRDRLDGGARGPRPRPWPSGCSRSGAGELLAAGGGAA